VPRNLAAVHGLRNLQISCYNIQLAVTPEIPTRGNILPNDLTYSTKLIPSFMELEISLPHSQAPATCSYPEPDQSSPCPNTLLITHFNITLTCMPTSSFTFPHHLSFQLYVLHARSISYLLTNIWWEVQIISVFSTFRYLVPLRQKILLKTLFSHNCRLSLPSAWETNLKTHKHDRQNYSSVYLIYILG
jgi:hypothetical protein